MELIWFPVQHPITQASYALGSFVSSGFGKDENRVVGHQTIVSWDGNRYVCTVDSQTEIETPHPHSDHYSCCHTRTRSTQPLPLSGYRSVDSYPVILCSLTSDLFSFKPTPYLILDPLPHSR